jgi:putative hydrolase of the HAD superfamily
MDVKSNKPEEGHFLKARELSRISFENTLHVGDHPVNDVAGARDLGINAVWFNVNDSKWELDKNPPLEFKKWSEFMDLIENNYGK